MTNEMEVLSGATRIKEVFDGHPDVALGMQSALRFVAAEVATGEADVKALAEKLAATVDDFTKEKIVPPVKAATMVVPPAPKET